MRSSPSGFHGNEDDPQAFQSNRKCSPHSALSDPDFDSLHALRNDCESINRGVDDSLYPKRAQSVGHNRQLLNLIGYAIMSISPALSPG